MSGLEARTCYRRGEMAAPDKPEKRRVGRPRKHEPELTDREPREHILETAARLFADKGIAEVSMLEIAQQSGLVQSSLYYYFRRKESIVAELLQQINRVPLAYAKQLRKEGDEPDVQLFRLVRFDVRNVCQFPLEITEVHRFSRRDRSAFETYWRERRELTVTLEEIVARGTAQGLFRDVDAYLCALTVIAQNESVQNWFWREPRAKGRAAPEDPSAARYRADEIAEFVATQTIAALVAAPSRVEQIKRRAKREPKG